MTDAVQLRMDARRLGLDAPICTPKCACPCCTFLTAHPELPSLTPISDKTDEWLVDCNWVSQLVDGKAVVIRRGVRTDGASIPRAAWRVVDHPWAKWLLPHALPHDGLYAAELFPRDECDKWFADSMALSGGHPIKRRLIYAAVRVCGWLVWRRHTKDGVVEARKNISVICSEDYFMLRNAQDITFPENNDRA